MVNVDGGIERLCWLERWRWCRRDGDGGGGGSGDTAGQLWTCGSNGSDH